MTQSVAPKPLTTSYAYPWALIHRGGAVPGQRPRCVLAFITEAVAVDGVIRGFKGVPHLGDCRPTKRARFIAIAEVVKTWRARPTAAALRRARSAIAKTQDVH